MSKSLGRGLTSNDDEVYSVSHCEYKKEIYLLTSGCSGDVDIFRLSDFGDSGFTGKLSFCLLGFSFFLF